MRNNNEGLTSPVDHQDIRPRNNLRSLAIGLVALAMACVPLALFAGAADEGLPGAWTFADARNWVGLARFCLASAIVVSPVLWLVRLSGREARHWAATLPATLALILALPMIPGTVIQLAWWIAG